jgi:hypothetical protein
VRFHFILCVSAENVTLLVFNKERKINKEKQRKEDNLIENKITKFMLILC